MLTTILSNAAGTKAISRGMSRDEISGICDNNSEIYTNIVSEAFEGRKASCHIGPSSFWVFSDSTEDVEKIKNLAKGMGYKNIKTIRPWTADANDNRIDDPRGFYAVDISSSTELIIGDTARSFVKLMSPMTDIVQENIVYRYAHMGTLTYYFDDKVVAELFKERAEEFIEIGAEIAGFAFACKVEKSDIDRWLVSIHLKT